MQKSGLLPICGQECGHGDRSLVHLLNIIADRGPVTNTYLTVYYLFLY